MGHTQNSCGTISMKKYGTSCITHLGVNFMSKGNSIIRLFKNKHSLIWFLFLGYPGEK